MQQVFIHQSCSLVQTLAGSAAKSPEHEQSKPTPVAPGKGVSGSEVNETKQTTESKRKRLEQFAVKANTTQRKEQEPVEVVDEQEEEQQEEGEEEEQQEDDQEMDDVDVEQQDEEQEDEQPIKPARSRKSGADAKAKAAAKVKAKAKAKVKASPAKRPATRPKKASPKKAAKASKSPQKGAGQKDARKSPKRKRSPKEDEHAPKEEKKTKETPENPDKVRDAVKRATTQDLDDAETRRKAYKARKERFYRSLVSWDLIYCHTLV